MSSADEIKIRQMTKDGVRYEDIPELRRLAKKVYARGALENLILPLFDAYEMIVRRGGGAQPTGPGPSSGSGARETASPPPGGS